MRTNILLIQEKSVKDDYFLKHLSDNLVKFNERFIILHQPVNANKVETWFYTKRISAKLSESMVGNLPFSAEHKNIFQWVDNQIVANQNVFYKNLQFLNVLVLNSVFQNQLWNVQDIFQALNKIFEVHKIVLFTQNPLSPLAATEPIFIQSEDNLRYYQNIYSEESRTFEWAKDFLPIYIANPQSFVKIF
jgi:hypothetical protein